MIGRYGSAVKKKLSAINVTGQPEQQIRGPLEVLFSALCELAGRDAKKLVLIGETDVSALAVRPDYAIEYDGALVGFIELKAPGKGADPRAFPWVMTANSGRNFSPSPTSCTPTASRSACGDRGRKRGDRHTLR